MKRLTRCFSLFLSVCILLSLMVISPLAAEGDPSAPIAATWEQLRALIEADHTSSKDAPLVITITAETAAAGADEYITIAENRCVSLVGADANGRGFKRTPSLEHDYFFYVDNNADLILENVTLDGGAVWEEGIVGGTNTGLSGYEFIFVNAGATLTLNDGAVLQNNAVSGSTAAVYLIGGNLIMNGGSIIDNYGLNADAAISVSGANDHIPFFIMNGGTVSGNVLESNDPSSKLPCTPIWIHNADFYLRKDAVISNNRGKKGGALFLGDDSYAELLGAIQGNTADYGGGIYLGGDAKAMLYAGGTISNNTAAFGGGVYVDWGLFGIRDGGGRISGNQAENAGGGIYLGGDGYVYFFDGSYVYDNTCNSKQNNLYLSAAYTSNHQNSYGLDVSTSLTSATKIGVSAQELPSDTLPLLAAQGDWSMSRPGEASGVPSGYFMTQADAACVVPDEQGLFTRYEAQNLGRLLFTRTDAAVTYHSVTGTASEGGSVNFSDTIPANSDYTLVVTPQLTPYDGKANDYKISTVTIDGTPQEITDPTLFQHTFSGISENHTVEAVFVPETYYTIYASGTLGLHRATPNWSYCAQGGSTTVSFTPSDGYFIHDIQVNGVSTGQKGPAFTLEQITQNAEIRAICYEKEPEMDVLIRSGSGTVTPLIDSTTTHGALTFSILPDQRYRIAGIHLNQINPEHALPVVNPMGQTCTFEDLVYSGRLFVTFEVLNDQFCGIELQSSAGGAILLGPQATPGPAVTGQRFADLGTSPGFMITPQAGFKIDTVRVDNVPIAIPDANSPFYYEFENISTHHSLSAAFTPISISGDGSAEFPYLISDAQALWELAEAVHAGNDYAGRHFRLTGNIDLRASDALPWIPIGTPEHPFRGSLDGDGFEISGMNVSATDGSEQYLGFFGYIADASVVDLTVRGRINAAPQGKAPSLYVGGLAGYAENSVIDHCTFTGYDITVTSENASGIARVGGLVGYMKANMDGRSYIRNCACTAAQITVKVLNQYVGGVTGAVNNVSIENCYNTAQIDAWALPDISRVVEIGGISGSSSYRTPIYNSFNGGAVQIWNHLSPNELLDSAGRSFGGVVGHSSGPVQNCCWLEHAAVSVGIGKVGASADDHEAVAVSADAIADGRLAQQLNHWFQTQVTPSHYYTWVSDPNTGIKFSADKSDILTATTWNRLWTLINEDVSSTLQNPLTIYVSPYYNGDGSLPEQPDSKAIRFFDPITIRPGRAVKLIGADSDVVLIRDAFQPADHFFDVRGSLVLERLILDGGAIWSGEVGGGNTGITSDGAFLQISDGGSATLNAEAVLRNNAVQSPVFSNAVFCGIGSTFTMNPGSSILRNYGSQSDSVVGVMSGTFAMNGGTIADNTLSLTSTRSNIATVLLNDSSMTMADGAVIEQNRAFHGGGVCLETDSKLTLSGGIVRNNTADIGGGVYISGNSAFYLFGGTVSGNTARIGGGAYHEWGLVGVGSASLIDNHATETAGGIYLDSSAYLYVYGCPAIFNNTAGAASLDSNVYLSQAYIDLENNGNGIDIHTDLDNSPDCRIGISSGTAPTGSLPIQVAQGDADIPRLMTADDAGHFFSDSSSYQLSFADDQLFLTLPGIPVGPRHTVSASVDGAGGSVYPEHAQGGDSASLNLYFYPDGGYELDRVLLDGETVAPSQISGNLYQLNNITSDHTVTVSYRAIIPPAGNSYTISTSTDGLGSVSPWNATVSEGEDITFTIIPLDGYQISALVIDGIIQPLSSTVTFTNVQADHWFNVNFTPTPTPVDPPIYIPPILPPAEDPKKPANEEPDSGEVLPAAAIYSDVPANAWYAAEVNTVVERGLFQGVGENSFAPNATMSRAMLSTALWRLAGTPAPSGPAAFADVSADAWFADSVAWAAESGIVAGTGSGFSPDGNVTREQMAVMLYQFALHAGYTQPVSDSDPEFADNTDISSWAVNAVAFCQRANLVNGRPGGIFDPAGSASRAEVAAILARFLVYIEGLSQA